MKFCTLILDRSGSMDSIWNEITKAVNDTMKRKAEDSLCSLQLFDQLMYENVFQYLFKYEENPKQLNRDNFNPRGGTPLRDAIMDGIETITKDFGDYLYQNFVEVEFIIFTDGEENSSRKWTSSDVARTINHFQDEYGWKFTFIGQGNNSDVKNYAKQFGIKSENTISYKKAEELEKAFAAV